MKKIIDVLLALAFAVPSHGQVELKKHSPNLAGHDALIREWLDTISISYVVTEKGEKFFVRDIRGHTTAVAASIPPEMTVTDMEAYSEYLYFCGTYKKNGHLYGMVGVLNAVNTFTWGQSYHIGLFKWVNNANGGEIRMATPKKVSCTKITDSSDIFVALVGDVEIKDAAGNITMQTAVCEAKSDALFSYWKSSYYYYPTNPEIVFTDITETDSFYVAVGRHANNNSTLIKPFESSVTHRPFTSHPDIQHDKLSGYTFVLQDMDYPVNATIASTVCEYTLPSFPYLGLFTNPGYNVHGLGAWSGAGFHTLGDNAGYMTYMRKRGGGSSSCGKTVKLQYIDNTNTVMINDLPMVGLPTPQSNIITDTITPILSPLKIIYDCVKD